MGESKQRENVLPTRMALQALKGRLVSAEKGYSLLKKKADSLTKRFRRLKAIIRKEKEEMAEYMKEAHLALAEASYAAGDINSYVQHSVSSTASVHVQRRIENIAGVLLPSFEEVREPHRLSLGLGRGGDQVTKARKAFEYALGRLIKLAADQASYLELEQVILVTSRRVNALENVVIPKIRNSIAYIDAVLEEVDREEFFRLKMVQASKERARDAEEREKAAAAAAADADAGADADADAGLLAEDPDIIF